MLFATSNTTALTIDGSQNATFSGTMTIGSRTGFTVHGSGNDLFIGSSTGDNGLTIGTAVGSNAYIFFADTDQNNRGYIAYQQANDLFRIGTAGTQRFQINATK